MRVERSGSTHRGLLLLGCAVGFCTPGLTGCGSGHGEAAAKTRLADTSSASYSTYLPLTGGQWIASEVDENGNTLVLAEAGGAQESPPLFEVVTFDPSGKHIPNPYPTGSGYADLHHLANLRVQGGIVAIGASYGGHPYDQPSVTYPKQALVYVGSSQWEGPQDSETALVDVCGDGNVVATYWADGPQVVALDGSANVLWQVNASTAAIMVDKIRCSGDGTIHLSGSSGAYAAAVQLEEADGTVDWTWTGSDVGASATTFDRDDNGDLLLAGYVGTGGATAYQVNALDPSGNLLYTWRSSGPSDSPAGISADGAGNAVITGARGAVGSRHFYTVSLDTGGNVLWTLDDPVVPGSDAVPNGVAFDASDDVFICGTAGQAQAVLYDPNGNGLWSYAQPGLTVKSTDVSNQVGRCIGNGQSGTLAVLSLTVP